MKDCEIYNSIKNNAADWLTSNGIFAKIFPANFESIKEFLISEDLVELSNSFNILSKKSPFEKSGVFIEGKCYTCKIEPHKEKKFPLKKILTTKKVDDSFYLDDEVIQQWRIAKGTQKTKRITNDGFEYHYSVGAMKFPDDLNEPARTIVTGEGGKAPSRFKHVVYTKYGYRRLTPIELEKINMFPKNHTEMKGISDTKRAFFMGNALVVGIIEKIGKELQIRILNNFNNDNE